MNKTYVIDYANIGLMLLSLGLAFIMPFELFLFSYAVLGPLHYLTEIGWLHKRGYFSTGKYDYLFLILMGVLITYASFMPKNNLTGLGDKMIALSFVAGAAFVFFKSDWLKVVAILVTLFILNFIGSKDNTFSLFFGIFLPTIIHVFLFTALFMLFGALKSGSKPGILSVVVLFGCAITIFIVGDTGVQYQVSEYVAQSWSQGFESLNYEIQRLFNPAKVPTTEYYSKEYYATIFNTGYGFVVARFIAFAYTYHYLNWFSKTNVIQWHKVSKPVLAGTIILWLAAVGLYLYDYGTGLKALFFLSFLHVLLEFPLNYQSFIGIGKEVGKLMGLSASKQQ